ncbi:MAG TPA: tetratricopeptide repeat protein [Nitrospiria bacterium]|jgi:predicted Zn-dependent protease|nr:tetratricopeptide repeat protein [Nitrospiria bacterium]
MLWLLSLSLAACSGLPRIVVLHDPLTPEEHVTLGSGYEAQGLTKQAAEEYQAALRKQPDDVTALVGLGNLSYQEGKIKDAERYYRKVLDRDPDHPMANNNLASVYLSLGKNLAEAEQLARRALVKESPHKAYFWETLASIHLRQGRLAEAQGDLNLADSLAPVKDRELREKIAQTSAEITKALARNPQP